MKSEIIIIWSFGRKLKRPKAVSGVAAITVYNYIYICKYICVCVCVFVCVYMYVPY